MVTGVAPRVLLGFALATAACGEHMDPGICQPAVNPLGAKYQYVVDSLHVPIRSLGPDDLGLNIDSDEADLPDNGFRRFLIGLSDALGGIYFLGDPDLQIARGQAIVLIQFQTTSLQTATGTAIWIVPGAAPSGTTAFEPAIDGADDILMSGQIVAGQVRAGPGRAVVQLPLFDEVPPLSMSLTGARLEGDATADHFGGLLGGAITVDDLEEQLIPGLLAQLNGVIALDCTGPPGPADRCGCTSERASRIVAAFDAPDPDCDIAAGELAASPIGPLLAPDVDLFAQEGHFDPHHPDGVLDGLSIGIRFTAVGARFPELETPDC